MMIKALTLLVSRVRPQDSLEHLILLWMFKRAHWSTPLHVSFFFFNHIPNNGLLWTKTSIKLYSLKTPIHRMISNYGSFYFNLNNNYLRVTQNITETLAAFLLVFFRRISKNTRRKKTTHYPIIITHTKRDIIRFSYLGTITRKGMTVCRDGMRLHLAPVHILTKASRNACGAENFVLHLPSPSSKLHV